ncbi:hypothetical protein [Bacillus ndiopicus]|uniref:hypothetical protein n=1 Tax=Bacillus ndiopicus TaxID=1347368 RepID=UPI0005A9672A|nr:hypothetical protein [Bacillus ndiopicus]
MKKRYLAIFTLVIVLLVGCATKETIIDTSDINISLLEESKDELDGKRYIFRVANNTEQSLEALVLYWEYPGLATEDESYRLVSVSENTSVVEQLGVGQQIDFQLHIPKEEGFLSDYPIDIDNPSLIAAGFVQNQEIQLIIAVDKLIE